MVSVFLVFVVVIDVKKNEWEHDLLCVPYTGARVLAIVDIVAITAAVLGCFISISSTGLAIWNLFIIFFMCVIELPSWCKCCAICDRMDDLLSVFQRRWVRGLFYFLLSVVSYAIYGAVGSSIWCVFFHMLLK